MALEPTALSDCKWTWMICWEVGLVEVLSAGILGSWSILALVRVSGMTCGSQHSGGPPAMLLSDSHGKLVYIS